MNKHQLLILLLIIALVFYYWNEKPHQPKPLIKKPPFSPKTIQPTKPNLPRSAIESVAEVKFGLNPPHSELNKPQASYPLGPSEPIDDFLTDDASLSETYRQRFLTLLNDFTATPLTQQATNALSTAKPLPHYFQALWDLKGLVNFSAHLAQPLREWINLTHPLKPADSPSDYGWLTDDNLEFILRNHQPIQSALAKVKHFQLRTDLANLYNSFQKARSQQDWDLPEFLAELTTAPYTLLPLRVSSNHWGLIILHNLTYQDSTPTYQVYYTSSGGFSLETEKQQLQPFLNQIGGETEIQIITPADRQSQGYNCGIYLVFYLQEILETGKLTLNRSYSEKTCQQFRYEWKERIGEKWCRI